MHARARTLAPHLSFRKEKQDWEIDICWLVVNPPSLQCHWEEESRNMGHACLLLKRVIQAGVWTGMKPAPKNQ